MNSPSFFPMVQIIGINSRLFSKWLNIYPLAIALGGISGTQVIAQTPNLEQIANDQIQLQQQREATHNQALIPTPNVKIDTNTRIEYTVVSHIDDNTPYFTIHQIGYTTLTAEALKDVHTFDFALVPATHGSSSLIGQCLGISQINQLVFDTQNRIIAQGYATTRVVITNQNLKSGTLLLTLIPSYLDSIKADTSQSKVPVYVDHTGIPANFASALPLKSGELLNIHHLETGLENLKRVPTADANFSISPSSRHQDPGYSDVLIKYGQSKKLRVGIDIDDSGTKATGKYQGNITLSLDNPSHHNDLLYL
ncbi:MAG: POTRA domain-containing protein [Moraxella sp.]|nr:POTRA domain-containing protein [Moraxella sp.]